MSPTAESPAFVGSQLIPTVSYLRQFVHSLRAACDDADQVTKKDLVAAHRSMMLYTLQLLCACTGHRAVGDPFWNLDQLIDPDSRMGRRQHGARCKHRAAGGCKASSSDVLQQGLSLSPGQRHRRRLLRSERIGGGS